MKHIRSVIFTLAFIITMPLALAQNTGTLNSLQTDEFVSGGDEEKTGIETQCVVFLHGLAQRAESMQYLANYIETIGFQVQNIIYDSKSSKIETLARAVENGIGLCQLNDASTIHLVGHSLGAILIRQYISTSATNNIGKIVLIAPPNRGSPIVNLLARNKERTAEKYGIAFLELGQGKEYFVNNIPIVGVSSIGIIAGSGKSTRNEYLFSMWIKGVDDGMVAVQSTRLKGVKHHITVPYSHHDIIYATDVHEQVAHFLFNGKFAVQ
ncbi:MAG: alpha/beta hydrolase [Alphaproteobacteria bacterium]|nr:alpha/beta hydrolase [Alphaproteobacteria bacterium]